MHLKVPSAKWRPVCMMTSSNGNIFRVTGPLCGEFTDPGEFPTQRPVTWSFDIFFDLRLNKWLSKQPWGWWLETPSWSLWRQCNGLGLNVLTLQAPASGTGVYSAWIKNHIPRYSILLYTVCATCEQGTSHVFSSYSFKYQSIICAHVHTRVCVGVCVSTYTHRCVVFFGWYENVGKWKRVLYYCPFVRVNTGTGGFPHKEQIIWMFLWCLPGGRFKNAYELLNLRALKIPILYKNRIFQCMSKIFCVEFQRVPLKFHTKYLTHTLKDVNFITRWNFKSS